MKKVLLLLFVLVLSGCKSHYTTKYKLETKNRNYYTNNISYVGDSVVIEEYYRNGEVRATYTLGKNEVIKIKE